MHGNLRSLFGLAPKSITRRMLRRSRNRSGAVVGRATDLTLESRILLAAQVISSDVPSKDLAAGQAVDIPVMYQTLNDNGVPAALGADRINFNLHFDSNALTFDSVRNVFGEGLIVNPGTPISENDASVTGDDGDPTTNMVLLASYTDNDAVAGWPNAPDSSGEILYIARFIARAGFTSSVINFSANQTGTVTGQGDSYSFGANGVTLSTPSGPTISIVNSPVTTEGEDLRFVVSLNVASTETVTVKYSTVDGNGPSGAIANEDYVPATDQTLTFAPGETQKTIMVATIDDDIVDPDESMSIVLSSPTGAAIGVREAEGPIEDNDGNLPRLTISDAGLVGEGQDAVFIVTLNPAAASAVTVQYSTENGQGPTAATSGVDFIAQTAQTLTFNAGETQKTITVATIDDSEAEDPREEFLVRLFNASGASVFRDEGEGIISDNDSGLPQFSITNAAAVTEGQNALFNVNLSAAAATAVTVTYSTANGPGPTGAISGADFNEQTNVTLTFNPGETQKTITVETIDDSLEETDEEFLVTLTAASGASISASQGTGTINDNDTASQASGDVDGDSDFDANDSFLIQLIKLSGTDAQIDQSKGSSSLSATQIRASVNDLGLGADVDGDDDFDANDAFLIHLVKLSGTDAQIDQSKGSSSLTATQIRANVADLTPSAGRASSGARSAFVLADNSNADASSRSSLPSKKQQDLFAVDEAAPSVIGVADSESQVDGVDQTWTGYRSWIDAL